MGLILLIVLIILLLGAVPEMAAQQKLGLWTKRRTRFAAGDRDYPVTAACVLS